MSAWKNPFAVSPASTSPARSETKKVFPSSTVSSSAIDQDYGMDQLAKNNMKPNVLEEKFEPEQEKRQSQRKARKDAERRCTPEPFLQNHNDRADDFANDNQWAGERQNWYKEEGAHDRREDADG